MIFPRSNAKAMGHIMKEILLVTKFLLDFFGIVNAVADFVKKCLACKNKKILYLKRKTEPHSIPVPFAMMN